MNANSSFFDVPGRVRSGEELDVARLVPLLEAALGVPVPELVVQQFPGGYSNLTYLVVAGERELVLRRPPFGSTVKSAHDMRREHQLLTTLSRHVGWAPRPLLFCDDASVLGADFYLMERVRGVILRKAPPTGLMIGPPKARHLSKTLLATLVELHALDYESLGLGSLGRPNGYVTRQIEGWTRRYGSARTDDIAAMDAVAEWLASHIPTSPPARILHNDLKFDNVVYDSAKLERIVGILDWEMATLGDPLMDLGTALGYWVEAGDPEPLKALSFGPTMLDGMQTRCELAENYARATGVDVSNIVFYYVFGLFKTAVVCQQIYGRYRQGKTSDPRFSGLIDAVRAMADKAHDHALRHSLS
ncbi:MAG: phosphotransferase family protein [Myxococcales bacterium]|nr:phosphotransferase family protein [Myxococcales bacterium]